MTEVMRELESLERINVGIADHDELLRRVWHRRRRRRGMIGAAALVTCAILAVGLLSALPGGSVGPEPVEAAARLTLPGSVIDTADSKGRLWVLACRAQCATKRPLVSLLKVSSRSGEIERAIAVAGGQALAIGGGSAWIANFAKSAVERVDPATGDVVATIPLVLPEAAAPGDSSFLPTEIQFGGESVWVSGGRGYVARIDPATNAVAATYQVPAVPGPLLIEGVHGSVLASTG
jgi:hypothetical protein